MMPVLEIIINGVLWVGLIAFCACYVWFVAMTHVVVPIAAIYKWRTGREWAWWTPADIWRSIRNRP